jgi:nucleotide-binding universal stress UspA family protein
MYKKILVPLDGSELAECTLSYVKNMVKNGFAKEVTILNVFKVDIIPPWVEQYGPDQQDLNKRIRETAAKSSANYLANVESRLDSEGIKAKKVSLEGNRPADTISDYARKNGMDLIVIATHGYTGLKKLMLGSVALGVLHEAYAPVLLITPEACRAQ